MTHTEVDGNDARVRLLAKEMVSVVSDLHGDRIKGFARMVWREPFSKRSWSELAFLVTSIPLAMIGFAVVGASLAAGVVSAVTFIGLAIIGISVRLARGFGRYQRQLARNLLDEEIAEPEPFVPRSGFLGWLQSALRDRMGWRSMAYLVAKIPLAAFGVIVGIACWWDAFACITYPLWGGNGNDVAAFGAPELLFTPSFFRQGGGGFLYGFGIFLTGIVFAFLAPWAVRVAVYLDRRVMRILLAPGALEARVRLLEERRALSVDSSAATLRRIERDLHDGTQAQLVALAMRLGMAKEKLAEGDAVDLEQVRQLVSDAHEGAKEAIVELRDLARGIHPPALDIGLAGALSTLAARCTVPTEVTLALNERPTQAIEAIAYFCVAELLANVSQHAQASKASITCSDHDGWLRLVVRDDGVGDAHLALVGSSSSGLAGLTDRVRSVDGQLAIDSPPRGPTVVTVDLPLHA
jgi:signal transduction histidine kinase/uncharacterized membrane protein